MEERQKLLLKSVPRKLSRWKRDPSTCSVHKIRKLNRLLKELSVDTAPFQECIEDLRKILKVYEVMES